MIDGRELIKHNSAKSCWVVVHGRVYDVTGKCIGAAIENLT